MNQKNESLEFTGILFLVIIAVVFVSGLGFFLGEQYGYDQVNSGAKLLYNCAEVQSLVKDSNPPEYEVRYSCDVYSDQ